MGLEMPRGLYTQERTTHKHKHAHCTTQRMMDCTPVGSSCRSFGKAPRKSRYSEKLFCCWLLAFGFWNVFLQNYATANLLLIPRWNSTTISSNGRERKKDRLRRRVDESRLRVRNGESRSNGT
ncbi:unnamed protein product [Fusarium graminearum]|nr:unnamed protein product [Fusarium graminearum]CAG1975055.1 unnamed protein product [Fusarium graminearum]